MVRIRTQRGAPITAGGATLVPVSRHVLITVGFAGGGLRYSYSGPAAVEVDGTSVRIIDWGLIGRIIVLVATVWSILRPPFR